MNHSNRRQFIEKMGAASAFILTESMLNACQMRGVGQGSSLFGTDAEALHFAFSENFPEFNRSSLDIVSGQLPKNMLGTYIKVGPAIQRRGAETVAHWFDGDPGLLRVNFHETVVEAKYRHIILPEARKEQVENRFIYSAFGKKRGGLLGNITNAKGVPNVTCYFGDNNEVLVYGDMGLPVVDASTLAHSETELGFLKKNLLTSNAHHHIDTTTGDVFGFGQSIVPFGFNVFHLDSSHRLKRKALVPLEKPLYAHDFAVTQNYIVLLCCPVRMHMIEGLSGIHSFSDATRFDPSLPTEIVILAKNDLSQVARFDADPFFFWHCGNAYERKDGVDREIVFEAITYQDFSSNTWLKSLPSGEIQADTQGTLKQFVINIKKKSFQLRGVLGADAGVMEFPKVSSDQFGRNASRIATVYRPPNDPTGNLWRGLAVVDQSGNTSTYLHSAHTYYGEPEIIRIGDREVILSVALNTKAKQSEIHLFESLLSNGPTCILALNAIVSPGFHGQWQS